MFLRNKTGVNAPPGVNGLRDDDRLPVIKVVSGDSWTVDADLTAPDGGPANPKNSCVEFVMSENQFSPPIWTGEWVNGIIPDENIPGLVHIRIPEDVTKSLRRGSYMFSVRVSDLMKFTFRTQLKGNFLVEYMPTSDHRSIPYRDGTSEIFGSASNDQEVVPSYEVALSKEVEKLNEIVQKKVDKVKGMGLSHNDFTDSDKEKVDDLKEVAITGSYDDLTGKPTNLSEFNNNGDGSSPFATEEELLYKIRIAQSGSDLKDRSSNKLVPNVVETKEWIWSDGETGIPDFNGGYWNIKDAVYNVGDDGKWTSPGDDGFKYDGPVAGSSSDTEITFSLTDTQQFSYSYFDYDSYQFVITVNGDTIYANGEYDEEYYDTIVKTLDYNGSTYTLEYPFSQYSEGSVSDGTATLADHVVTKETTYGPTITLTMPPAVDGHVRDLIVRIDLSQEAGAPPVAFAGGAFETADGEMPELVKGVNLLSFTETDTGVFGVAYKEMKPITAQGGS